MTPGAATLLVVDDEASLQRSIGLLLRSRGYRVVEALTGRDALAAADRDKPDLVILDLGLPDLDGLSVCEELRRASDTPILVLSARGGETDKVAALDLGADDYVTKPFAPEELLARIRAALRRRAQGQAEPSGRLAASDLTIDYDRRRVIRGTEEIRLTPKEFEVLEFLARQPGRVLTHRAILKAVWGPNAVHQPELLRVVVGALRKKLEPDTGRPRYIITEPWTGYRFADPE
jgi:two-component system, OmpR family, KDP operon response regulator KdpE